MVQNGLHRSAALLFGHEESLLLSRKWLLSRTGCECSTVTTLSAYREKVLSSPVDLIILCQTSSSDECAAATEFAAEHLPQAQLLIMFSRDGRCDPEQNYVLLDATAGPAVFMQTTERMLAKNVMRAG